MEPNRRAVVESYVKHFKQPTNYLEPIEQSRLASATIKAVRKDGTFSFYVQDSNTFHRLRRLSSLLNGYFIQLLGSSVFTCIVPNAPFYKLIDFSAMLPDRYTGNMFGNGSVYDPVVQAKYGLSIQVSDTLKFESTMYEQS